MEIARDITIDQNQFLQEEKTSMEFKMRVLNACTALIIVVYLVLNAFFFTYTCAGNFKTFDDFEDKT